MMRTERVPGQERARSQEPTQGAEREPKRQGPASVRQAVAEDIPELVRLRALLFEDLGGEFFHPAGAGPVDTGTADTDPAGACPAEQGRARGGSDATDRLSADAAPFPEGDWRHALTAVLKEQVTSDAVRILVVDGEEPRPGGRLAACGIGTVEQRLPGPHLRNGLIGHVIGVVTDPDHRRRGHSRAVMRELLDWFGERGAARVDLYASAEGEPLYRALGFDNLPDPALYWRP